MQIGFIGNTDCRISLLTNSSNGPRGNLIPFETLQRNELNRLPAASPRAKRSPAAILPAGAQQKPTAVCEKLVGWLKREAFPADVTCPPPIGPRCVNAFLTGRLQGVALIGHTGMKDEKKHGSHRGVQRRCVCDRDHPAGPRAEDTALGGGR